LFFNCPPSAASSGSPARSSADKLLGTSSAAVGGHPAATPLLPLHSPRSKKGPRRSPGRLRPVLHFQPGQGTLLGGHGHPQRVAPAAPRTLQPTRGQHHTSDPGGCLARRPNRDWATSCSTCWPSRAPSPPDPIIRIKKIH